MTERGFYRTRFVYEVLSEEPIPDDVSLLWIINEAEDGAYSGFCTDFDMQLIDGKSCAEALKSQGSDPSFFQLTDRGEDI